MTAYGPNFLGSVESALAGGSQTRPLLHQSQSLNLLGSQEAAAGWQYNGRMSSVRRFFCLYCTFDMLFTTLVWLLSVMLTGESISLMWKQEVLGYTIYTSLLDIVAVGIIRFLVLVLVYGAIHLNHWSVVALSTSLSCIFLIAKVFIFDWVKSPQPVFQVLLILLSFTLCWGEAWFMDCKVLPQEYHARQILASIEAASQQVPYFVPGPMLGLPSDMTSVADFYSPAVSPEHSPKSSRKYLPPDPVLDEEYKKKAKKCMEESWELLNAPGWSKAKSGPEEGDLVEVLNHNIHGKIFRLTGFMECPAEFLYNEFTQNVEDMPRWNPAILDSKLVKTINEDVDITYQVTAGGGGGAVKPRDFVNLRMKGRIGKHYLSSGVSVEYPGFPPTSNFIRGQNNVGCWAMEDINVENGKAKCRFQWLMGCNLKGWIPQYVLDVAFTTAMLEFLDHLRTFIQQKKREGVL